MFNKERYVERATRGEIQQVITREGAPRGIELPTGSVSQTVSYRDENNRELARAHQYLLPDGTLGASGKPDPKRILHEGKLYRLEKSSKTQDADVRT